MALVAEEGCDVSGLVGVVIEGNAFAGVRVMGTATGALSRLSTAGVCAEGDLEGT